jgi:hypothetical protein
VVVLLGLWASLIVRIGLEPEWMVPVTAALALPIVRLVTAGGGLIPPIQWVLLGFVAGAMAYRQALRSASDTDPVRRPDHAGVDHAGVDHAGVDHGGVKAADG